MILTHDDGKNHSRYKRLKAVARSFQMIMEDVHGEDPSTNWNKIKRLHDHEGTLHIYWNCDNKDKIPENQLNVISSLWEACGEVSVVYVLNDGLTSDILLSKY